MTTDPSDSIATPRKSRVLTRGRPFEPGNPGRPKGARNKATLTLEAMFEDESRSIGRKAIELAKKGRFGAIKLVIDRTCPSAKARRRIQGLALPPLTCVEDAALAMGAIATAAAAGTLAVEDARDMAEIVEVFRKTRELGDIEQRIKRIEQDSLEQARAKAQG